jgi:hypothetical protein
MIAIMRPIDPAALDPEARRLAERGAKDLQSLTGRPGRRGEAFDTADLETLSPWAASSALRRYFARSHRRVRFKPERRGGLLSAAGILLRGLEHALRV